MFGYGKRKVILHPELGVLDEVTGKIVIHQEMRSK